MKCLVLLVAISLLSACSVSTSGGGAGGIDGVQNNSPTPEPPASSIPLKMVIENYSVMAQPTYIMAKKKGNAYALYFLKDISPDRAYYLCSDNLDDLGLQETLGRITIRAAVGTYNVPSNAGANVNLDSSTVYNGFGGIVQITSISNGQISGLINLAATSPRGNSSWSGNFQAMICAQEGAFFNSKNLGFPYKKVTLKSNSESIPGSLKLTVINGEYGGGGRLAIDFSPDLIPGTQYYPKGFNFETEVRLFGGRMLNQQGKVVGEYSNSTLSYSTKNGAYSSIVDPFDFEVDYSDVNTLKLKFTTPKGTYNVIF